MTSASELFYRRRSHNGRNADLGFDSVTDRNPHISHHHHHHHPHRHGHHHRWEEDCDPFRRSSHGPLHARHLCHRISQMEHVSVRLDHSASSPVISNISAAEASNNRTNRQRFTRNDRLPGSVIQARARLSERLRGVSLPGNRQLSRAAGLYVEFATAMLLTDPTGAIDLPAIVQNPSKKKPPGLSQEAINSLPQEVFSFTEEDAVTRAGHECSICLEQFWEGEHLIRLACGHGFHPLCLNPWVRACGDCPYCRTGIAVEYEEEKNTKHSLR